MDTRDQVPVGSSTASIYPGYSPAEHEYGKAGAEYGEQVAAARAKGMDVNPVGLDYETGQARGIKRSTRVGVRAAIAVREGRASSGSGSDALAASGSPSKVVNDRKENTAAEVKKPEVETGSGNPEAAESKQPEATVLEDTNPYFVIDVNPTPVNLPGMPMKPLKRSATTPEREESKKHKKAKIKHVNDNQHEVSVNGNTVVEFEDISQEVDERIKAKEEKRKQKAKKRKKSEDESVAPKDNTIVTEETEQMKKPSADDFPHKQDPSEAEEPKKKKLKKANGATANISPSKHEQADDLSRETEQPKKKKRKKSTGITADLSDSPAAAPPSNVPTEVPQPAAEEALSRKRHAGDEDQGREKKKKKKRRKSEEA